MPNSSSIEVADEADDSYYYYGTNDDENSTSSMVIASGGGNGGGFTITGSLKWDIFVVYIMSCVVFITTCCVTLFFLFWCYPARESNRPGNIGGGGGGGGGFSMAMAAPSTIRAPPSQVQSPSRASPPSGDRRDSSVDKLIQIELHPAPKTP